MKSTGFQERLSTSKDKKQANLQYLSEVKRSYQRRKIFLCQRISTYPLKDERIEFDHSISGKKTSALLQQERVAALSLSHRSPDNRPWVSVFLSVCS